MERILYLLALFWDGLGLFALFVVHQLSLWLSLDPERAFHAAKTLVSVYASAWDTSANLYNPVVDVALSAIPAWNAASKYIAEPIVFTALDVLSIAFAHRPYGGVISENEVPYNGYSCPADGSVTQAAGFCGKLSYYEKQLGYASSPESFVSNSTIVFNTAMMRRLSDVVGEPLIGALDLSALTDSVQALLGSFVVLLGSLSDIVFHVAWTLVSELFELIFNSDLVRVWFRMIESPPTSDR